MTDYRTRYSPRLAQTPGIEISETEVENLRRADISVSFADDPDQVIDRLSAFIEPPAPNGFVPVRWTSGPGDIG